MTNQKMRRAVVAEKVAAIDKPAKPPQVSVRAVHKLVGVGIADLPQKHPRREKQSGLLCPSQCAAGKPCNRRGQDDEMAEREHDRKRIGGWKLLAYRRGRNTGDERIKAGGKGGHLGEGRKRPYSARDGCHQEEG